MHGHPAESPPSQPHVLRDIFATKIGDTPFICYCTASTRLASFVLQACACLICHCPPTPRPSLCLPGGGGPPPSNLRRPLIVTLTIIALVMLHSCCGRANRLTRPPSRHMHACASIFMSSCLWVELCFDSRPCQGLGQTWGPVEDSNPSLPTRDNGENCMYKGAKPGRVGKSIGELQKRAKAKMATRQTRTIQLS